MDIDALLKYVVVPEAEQKVALEAMRRGSRDALKLISMKYKVASAINAQDVKDQCLKEAEIHAKTVEYVDGVLGKEGANANQEPGAGAV